MAIEKWVVEQGDTAASEDLNDVVLDTAAVNECLVRNGSDQWVNQKLDLASFADSAQSQLIGRGSGGSGVPQYISIDDSLVMNAAVLERAELTGDVTAPQGSNTTTIATSAVELAMQADMVQARLLGRGGASGTGAPELLTIGSGLSMAGTVLSATAGGASDSVQESINQATHGFAAGDVLRHNGTIFTEAQADSVANSNSVGVVQSIEDASNFTIVYSGKISITSFFTAGSTHYLSTSVAGGLTTSDPGVDEISKPIVIALTTTDAIVVPQRGIEVTGSAGGGDPSSSGLSGYVYVDDAGDKAVVADHTDRVLNGNARGANAVDLQTDRSGAAFVASGANAVICGGQSNNANAQFCVTGGGFSNYNSGDYGVIAGGNNNTASAGDYAVVGGGQDNNAQAEFGTVPGGRETFARRKGELAYGGATAVEAQATRCVASVKTTDATPTTLGYTTTAQSNWNTTTLEDTATIPFVTAGTYVMTFRGTVVCMRAETTNTAGAWEIKGAMKKDSGGTVAFVGTPSVTLIGEDDGALDVTISLAGSDKGALIQATGKASETYVWACEWTGAEIHVPAL